MALRAPFADSYLRLKSKPGDERQNSHRECADTNVKQRGDSDKVR